LKLVDKVEDEEAVHELLGAADSELAALLGVHPLVGAPVPLAVSHAHAEQPWD
jgi:hypothetical protein